jgi:hypothetical protein
LAPSCGARSTAACASWHGAGEAELVQAPDGRLVWIVAGREFGYATGNRPELIAVVDVAAEIAMLVDAEAVIVERLRYVRPGLN